MKWITREKVKVDRVACPWLIRKFVDTDAVTKHGLADDAALVLLAKIVNGADTDNSLWRQPESAGLNAVAEGFRRLGFTDDHALNAAEWIVYDALYAYCQEMIRQGKPEGKFKSLNQGASHAPA